MRDTTPSRDLRLQQLKAFGLFIKGDQTLYQIAVKLGIADVNPSTAAGRARTRISQGWRIICDRKVARWDRYWSGVDFPLSQWQALHGARLWTHPRASAQQPAPDPTPLDRLLARLEDVAGEAAAGGFHQVAIALRNMQAALRYNAKLDDTRQTGGA